MNHEQFITRSNFEFSNLINMFFELNSVYDNQFTLYLDTQGWELFDLRRARSIYRYDFKHIRQFTDDMRILSRDFLNLSSGTIHINRGKRPKSHETWSIKKLMRLYGTDDKYLFNQNVINYVRNGIKKENDLENRMECD